MRRLLAIFLGFGVAVALITLMEAIGSRLWIQPPVLSLDRAGIAASINQMPTMALWWVAIGYGVGGLAGSFLARKISGGVSVRPSIAVGVLLIVASVLNSQQIPQPRWLDVMCIIASLVGATTGALLANYPPRNFQHAQST